MISLNIEACVGCGKCVKICTFGGIRLEGKTPVLTPQCTACGACVDACPVDAIIVERGTDSGCRLEAFAGIWVIAEQRGGVLHPVSLELLGAARELAAVRGTDVRALLMGHEVTSLADDLARGGADHVYVADHPLLAQYRTLPCERVAGGLIARHRPEVVLIGATTIGRDLAPRLANRFRTGLTADCTGLAIDPGTQMLLQTRPAFGGNIMATITTPRHRPQMATVRPGVMQPWQGAACPLALTPVAVTEDSSDDLLTVLRQVPKQHRRVALDRADVIVAGGRGMRQSGNFQLLEQLADALGGEVAASRSAVELGWADHGRQVGQTGQTVRPRLYIACGISGAIQHLAGMQQSDIIVAINRDPLAPIFSVAQYGLVGDINRMLPALLTALAEA